MACELLFRMFHAYRAVSVIDFKPGARCAPPGMLRCPPIIHFRRRIPGPFRGRRRGGKIFDAVTHSCLAVTPKDESGGWTSLVATSAPLEARSPRIGLT